MIAVLAKRFSISKSGLRNWMGQDGAEESGGDSRSTSAEKRELIQLRRDKPRLEMGNEILKRAAAYFALVPVSSSELRVGLRTASNLAGGDWRP